MKILIAEDDIISNSLLKKTLRDWGHEVLIAYDGNKALDLFQKENIKLIIADWLMPGIDGIELCKKIRQSQTSGYVYIILLTGKDSKEDIVAGLNAGADDYIVKPFLRAELKVRVRAGERIINLEKELIDKNRKLEDLVCIDPLMEIYNRRSFYQAIENLHNLAFRYGHSYGIIMVDVDYFKSFNDMYGHLKGDDVLKKVAKNIKALCRNSDEVFRYGGEEILVILPEQNKERSVAAAERIRKGIESLALEHKGSDKKILTVSCGVSVFDKKEGICKWEVVLDRADKALYKAKKSGRNMVSEVSVNLHFCPQ